MNGTYIFNKETTKLELHFNKSDYDALSQDIKSRIKSNFLWSKYGQCWVSRSKEPNLHYALKLAKDLELTNAGNVGERLTYSEQVQKAQARAEARAERYENHAEQAKNRAISNQKPINDLHGDIAFFTQPNIKSSSGRSFTNYREKLFARYVKGFDDYRKSDYYLKRAEKARCTANMSKLNDKGYLMRKVKECIKSIKCREKRIISLEAKLYQVENGEILKNISGELITGNALKDGLAHEIELIEVEMDKQAFFLNRIDALGGIRFNRENIKRGDIVKLHKHNITVEVVSTGNENIKYMCCGLLLTASYAEISEIIQNANTEARV